MRRQPTKCAYLLLIEEHDEAALGDAENVASLFEHFALLVHVRLAERPRDLDVVDA